MSVAEAGRGNQDAIYIGANSQDGLEADLENLAQDMKQHIYQINLGNRKEEFRLNDIIFMLERPTKIQYIEDVACISCDKKLTRKNPILCQFCGHRACEKCCFKTRPFVKTFRSGSSSDSVDGKDAGGKVCRVCDKKFILRSSCQEIAAESVRIDKNKDELIIEMKRKDSELAEYQAETKKVRELIEIEERKYQLVAQENKKKLADLQAEQEEMKEMREILQQKVNKRKEQSQKLKQ